MIPHIESQSFHFLIYLCLIENRSPFCGIAGNTTRSNSILRRTTIHSATLLKGHRFVRSSFSNWTLWTQGPPRICSEAVSNGRGHKLVCSVHEGPQHLLWKRRNCASISSQWNLCYHKSWFTGLGYRSATSPSSLAHTRAIESTTTTTTTVFLPTFCRGCGFQWRTMSPSWPFHFLGRPPCNLFFTSLGWFLPFFAEFVVYLPGVEFLFKLVKRISSLF